ncbi:hypothetical protein BHE74_00035960 [Ensete ventricosum]|nr:hypothetical protein BHE74_00035960 [Ensete ventricosum]
MGSRPEQRQWRRGLRGSSRGHLRRRGASSPKLSDTERLVISGPPSSAKMLLDDSPCPRTQHDVVRPA